MLRYCNGLSKPACIFSFHAHLRFLSSSEVTTALRPFYFLVHPDLFARYPRVQHANDVNLKILNGHFDSLLTNSPAKPIHLQFYIRDKEDEGALKVLKVYLVSTSLKAAIHDVLKTFSLPTKYVDSLKENKMAKVNFQWMAASNIDIGLSHFKSRENFSIYKREEKLYSWLVSNMGEAEKRLSISEPIRNDIDYLSEQLIRECGLQKITWMRGIGTVHLRGCLQTLIAVLSHPGIKPIIQGRHIHFGNETGLSLGGTIVLSTSEVRDQWFKLLTCVEEKGKAINRIPFMQQALSNVLKGIEVTHRKYQTFLLAENYSKNMQRLVTSLGDYRGKTGFPASWPSSLNHLQLVVESASGPLMLSPTGQILAPASCPPSLLVSFITENMYDASRRIESYQEFRKRERTLHEKCQVELGLEFLDKDDSVVPEKMVESLEKLMKVSYRLTPLLTGARLWITQYYSVMLDGEICIPWDWDL